MSDPGKSNNRRGLAGLTSRSALSRRLSQLQLTLGLEVQQVKSGKTHKGIYSLPGLDYRWLRKKRKQQVRNADGADDADDADGGRGSRGHKRQECVTEHEESLFDTCTSRYLGPNHNKHPEGTSMRGLLFVIMGLFVLACDNEPSAVRQVALPTPSPAPQIDRSVLTSQGSFRVGYLNGNIRSTSVTLKWQPCGGPDFLAYKIIRGPLPVDAISDPAIVTGTDSNLAQDTYYRYTVSVMTRSGTHRDDSVTIKTPQFLPPTISLLQVHTDTSVQVAWTRSAESATAFRVERASSDSIFQLLATPGETYFFDRSVEYGHRYSYRIRALNIYEATPPSPAQSVLVVFLVDEGFESGRIPVSWTTGGDAPWFVSTVNPYGGSYSVRSGVITQNQTSYIQCTDNFIGIGTISFWYRVSSEPTNDALIFKINGMQLLERSGETGWQHFSTTHTGAGAVTLRWEYHKGDNVSAGEDAARIDDVMIQ